MSKPIEIVILILRIISDLIHYIPREIRYRRRKNQKKHKKSQVKEKEEKEMSKDDNSEETNKKDNENETKKALIKID